jgi:hypothetical protein
MSFEENLAKKAKDSKYLSISELATTIEGNVIGEPTFKTDKRGNEALYLTIALTDGAVVQKFGKSLYEKLLKDVKACGGLQVLQQTKHKWVQEKAGRATFNRYFPVPNKTDKKIE